MSGGGRRSVDLDVQKSKTMTYLLRHSRPTDGLNIRSDGFVEVKSLLACSAMKQKKCTLDDVLRIVENDRKTRFALQQDNNTNELMIRANQGHSRVPVENLDLTLIVDPAEIPIVVHGTFRKFWDSIKEKGLSRMNRQHIHFAGSEKPQLGSGAIRAHSQIMIYVDAANAMKDGIKFFKSANNVILSPGDENGVIACEYFSSVVDVKSKTNILL